MHSIQKLSSSEESDSESDKTCSFQFCALRSLDRHPCLLVEVWPLLVEGIAMLVEGVTTLVGGVETLVGGAGIVGESVAIAVDGVAKVMEDV